MSEGKRHRAQVDRLLAAGAKSNGFIEDVIGAVAGGHGSHERIAAGPGPDDWYTECHRCGMKEDLPDRRLIPDAYRIAPERKEVTVYEVEVASPISAEKLEAYIDLWWLLDEDYWMLRLIIVNQFGHENEVDLFACHIGSDADPGRVEEVRAYMGIRKPGEAA